MRNADDEHESRDAAESADNFAEGVLQELDEREPEEDEELTADPEEEGDELAGEDHPTYQLEAVSPRVKDANRVEELEALRRENRSLKRRIRIAEERTPKSEGAGSRAADRQRGFLRHQRVALFVDVQNMYHSAKKLHGRNLSYAKLLERTVRGRQLIRATAYVIDRQGIDQEAFIDHLRNTGFQVRRKELVERPDGSRKGNWDLGLALDAIHSSPKVDVVILVTGDGDFAPLITSLTGKGVIVELACFGESASEALVQQAERLHYLGKNDLY